MQNTVVNFKGKLVLITGASSGIGRETAIAFAKKKAILAISGRNKKNLISLKTLIENQGGKVKIFPFDLTNTSKIPLLIDEIKKEFNSTIDVLINNAGVSVFGLIENIPQKEYLQVMKVNFLAPVALTQAVIPGMKEKEFGLIINISSGAAKRGLPLLSAYCSSKAAFNSFTESVRVELVPYGIKIMSFSPGLVETSFTARTKSYGRDSNPFSEGRMLSSKMVSQKIVQASERLKRDVILSNRTKFTGVLNTLFPQLFDSILARIMKNGTKAP